MIRYGAIALLFLSVFLMIRGISETWKNKALPSSTVTGKQSPLGESVGEDIIFNPTLSPDMPDFKVGYLFNEQRVLEEDKGPAPVPEEENLAGNDLGIQTNINETTYSGAIIGDTFKKAIITFTPAPEPAATKGKTSRLSRRTQTPKKSSGALQTTQLEEGDLISGYKVASIGPDKIVFTKAEEVIEKYIYDPNKKRAQPVSRAQPATIEPPRPMDGAPAAPQPTQTTQSTPAAAATQQPASAETPGRQTVTARQPSTARRLVVSRKPPARPDTSRVSRRRSSSSSIPSAPGGPPGMTR